MNLMLISDDLPEFLYLFVTHPWISLIWFEWQRWWKWEWIPSLNCDYSAENIWTDGGCIAQISTAFAIFLVIDLIVIGIIAAVIVF